MEYLPVLDFASSIEKTIEYFSLRKKSKTSEGISIIPNRGNMDSPRRLQTLDREGKSEKENPEISDSLPLFFEDLCGLSKQVLNLLKMRFTEFLVWLELSRIF